MGASLSNLTESAVNGGAGPGLGDIPESCVACVFMYLTPPEICNLARLNRAFRGAASADTVWESKLPPNYPDLLDLFPAEIYRNICKKKDIFALLSRPVPFDGGTKVVWLDRVTGGVCVSVSAKAMAITGIEDRRYWSWIPTEESKWRLGMPRWRPLHGDREMMKGQGKRRGYKMNGCTGVMGLSLLSKPFAPSCMARGFV